MNAYKAVATRIVNAEEKFIEYAMNTASLTRTEAISALMAYQKYKVIKIDAIGGQFTFKHGIYGDKDVLQKAAQEQI